MKSLFHSDFKLIRILTPKSFMLTQSVSDWADSASAYRLRDFGLCSDTLL